MFNGSKSTSVTSALGTLIGYVGSEAATEDVFERLLWPQRFFNHFSWRDMIQVGFLNPMGGPMHKAALTTLDQFHQNGLFRGRNLGNMLGTAFFHDTKQAYRMHDPPPPSTGEELVRNGLWVQAIRRIPIVARNQEDNNVESGLKPRKLLRARSVVNFLELSYAHGEADPMKTVKHDLGSLTFRTFLAIVWSEITGIAMGVFVLAYWQSYFAFIWFLPLTLRLLSAFTTIQREGLLSPPLAKEADMEVMRRFEVNTYGHGFLLIEGKESAVLQFFRHYGHPIRNRARELLQMAIIVALGLVFPIGLMSSLIWMPVGLQYLWLGYQLYATMAMYTYRFTREHQQATSESRLAQKFAEGKDEERVAYLQDEDGNTMKGKLTQIYVDNYGEGLKVLQDYLAKRPQDSPIEEITDPGISEKRHIHDEKPNTTVKMGSIPDDPVAKIM
ncbi:MAG: hypothetical protein Q9213_000169 [Squamulea squamosa]